MLSASIIINTLNRRTHLESALRAIGTLDYPNIEVIVVNGPSTDGTSELLQGYRNKIKIGSCSNPNLSESRNAGIKLASGDVIFFLDDDAVPHPEWVTRLMNCYHNDPAVGAVGGFTVDNTGVRWQVKKTICDRFGDAFFVGDHFDERQLNRSGSPYYPSILGANSSFRASALRQIGGFDEVFAYFLDETDVCLRLVDHNWKVIYEPRAIVFHQSAASDLRTPEKVPTTLKPSVTSKTYFILKHGARISLPHATARLAKYKEELLKSNLWLAENGRISWQHRAALDRDIIEGVAKGTEKARMLAMRDLGDLPDSTPPEFLQYSKSKRLRIALVSSGFPPNVDAGIARWTSMLAKGLAKREHEVHVITRATGDEAIEYQNGIWLHKVSDADTNGVGVSLCCEIPSGHAKWAKRVWQEVQFIKGFGLDVLSFPIWDLEGVACLDDPEIGIVMSLHTSYALAFPFKPEWQARPIFEALTVAPVIAKEKYCLQNAPVILANSHAIVDDMEAIYGVEFRDRVVISAHGTEDLLTEGMNEDLEPRNTIRVLYVGRFEARKGIDLMLEATRIVLAASDNVHFWFAGGRKEQLLKEWPEAANDIHSHDKCHFFGELSRPELEELFRSCDVVVMPSRYESFGLVAIEAMSASKPVIALSAGGLGEVVSEQCGFLIDDNVDAAKNIAEKILCLKADSSLYARLSRGARDRYLKNYTISRMVESAEEAYLRAAAMRRS